MDVGHEETEKLLTGLETKLANEYAIAVHDVQQKLTAYLQETEEGRKKQEDLLKAGEISKKDYSDWIYRHTMVGKRWSELRDTLAADLSHANEIALGIIKGTMPDVFALNANYGTFQVEQSGKIDTGFTLYNHDTAAYLLGDQRQLMPKPSAWKEQQIAANKDMQWNKEKIQSAVLQGVLQGESPHKVADRLMQVGQMDYNAAVRYARTMTTSAQNAGRYESYRRAESLGVELIIEWEATLDGRTRHDHRLMHGMRTTVDEPFETPDGYTIYYPADCSGASDAPQEEIWNCRCTLLAWVKGFEGETVRSSPAIEGMSFEEWQNGKKEEEPAAPAPAAEKTFKEKVDEIKERIAQNGGTITEQDLKDAGRLVAEEYDAMAQSLEEQLRQAVGGLEIEVDMAHEAYLLERQRYDEFENKLYEMVLKHQLEVSDVHRNKELQQIGEDVDKARTYWQDLRRQLNAVQKQHTMTPEQKADWLAAKIGEIRQVGADGLNLKAHLNNSSSQVVPDIQFAYNRYPKSWVEKSVQYGKMSPRAESRGYYSHISNNKYPSDIRISGTGTDRRECSFHELAHRFEKVVGGIMDAEKAFYDRRTDGVKEERLCDIYKGYGYKVTEVTKRDDFIHPYMGKSYGGYAYELVSMGFEYAYMSPETLAKDKDMQEWIYGTLLLK